MIDERSAEDLRQISVFRRLLWAAGVTAFVALLAGVLLLAMDPESSAEGTLGIAAAVSGLLTGALAGMAAIYAQVKNLWRFAPTWGRVVAWVVIVAFAVYGILQAQP